MNLRNQIKPKKNSFKIQLEFKKSTMNDNFTYHKQLDQLVYEPHYLVVPLH